MSSPLSATFREDNKYLAGLLQKYGGGRRSSESRNVPTQPSGWKDLLKKESTRYHGSLSMDSDLEEREAKPIAGLGKVVTTDEDVLLLATAPEIVSIVSSWEIFNAYAQGTATDPRKSGTGADSLWNALSSNKPRQDITATKFPKLITDLKRPKIYNLLRQTARAQANIRQAQAEEVERRLAETTRERLQRENKIKKVKEKQKRLLEINSTVPDGAEGYVRQRKTADDAYKGKYNHVKSRLASLGMTKRDANANIAGGEDKTRGDVIQQFQEAVKQSMSSRPNMSHSPPLRSSSPDTMSNQQNTCVTQASPLQYPPLQQSLPTTPTPQEKPSLESLTPKQMSTQDNSMESIKKSDTSRLSVNDFKGVSLSTQNIPQKQRDSQHISPSQSIQKSKTIDKETKQSTQLTQSKVTTQGSISRSNITGAGAASVSASVSMSTAVSAAKPTQSISVQKSRQSMERHSSIRNASQDTHSLSPPPINPINLPDTPPTSSTLKSSPSASPSVEFKSKSFKKVSLSQNKSAEKKEVAKDKTNASKESEIRKTESNKIKIGDISLSGIDLSSLSLGGKGGTTERDKSRSQVSLSIPKASISVKASTKGEKSITQQRSVDKTKDKETEKERTATKVEESHTKTTKSDESGDTSSYSFEFEVRDFVVK